MHVLTVNIYASFGHQEVNHAQTISKTNRKMCIVAQFCQSCLSLSYRVCMFIVCSLCLSSVMSLLMHAQYFGDGSSSPSSVLGMSKISANNGGSRMKVQFERSQSRWDTCMAPNALSSVIFASRAGIICRALVEPGLVRTI